MTNTKLLKGGLIGLGAVVLSTIGIFAADSMQGIDRDLVGLSTLSVSGVCPAGMTLLERGVASLCVDTYEASAADGCPHTNPLSIFESEKNIEAGGCYAASVVGKQPWRFVSLAQAQRICAAAGKRLPTNKEWYDAALGTKTESCVVDGTEPKETGSEGCVSKDGVYDMIGNVWEWVDEQVVGQTYDGRELPETGYVASVDAAGVAVTTNENENELYGEDYFWSKEGNDVYGVIRGGFFNSGSDAGVYAINTSIPTSFSSKGVGFRCVLDAS